MGSQGWQGDLEALRSTVVLAAGSKEMGQDRTGGARGCEGAPVRCLSRGGLEVTGPNITSKPPRIAFKARRRR